MKWLLFYPNIYLDGVLDDDLVFAVLNNAVVNDLHVTEEDGCIYIWELVLVLQPTGDVWVQDPLF